MITPLIIQAKNQYLNHFHVIILVFKEQSYITPVNNGASTVFKKLCNSEKTVNKTFIKVDMGKNQILVG